jgi:hypothetical protein
METIVDLIGWIGSILLISAYWLNSTNKINAQSIEYQCLNIIGSICFIITTVYHKAYPPAALNVVWVIIGIYYLVQIWKKNHKY